MKGQREYIRSALALLPKHRQDAGKRKQALNLDQLLDETRSLEDFAGGSLDFVFMSYRYWYLFLDFKKTFTTKTLKPEKMEDLWALGFAALLTRDNTTPEILVNDLVEVSKKTFGPHTGAISNAFFRKVLSQKAKLLESLEKSPELLLGPVLQKRWQSHPDLRATMGVLVSKRPPSGIFAFDTTATLSHFTSETFKNALKEKTMQAMNPGSWEFLEWLHKESSPHPSPIRILDACAAPGGKTLGLWSLFKKENIACKIFACDSKFGRLDRLKDNVQRWELESSISCHLLDWQNLNQNEISEIQNFGPHLILADLPCSGLGTLHSRPDLLLEDIESRMEGLFEIQKRILDSLFKHLSGKQRLLFVSICSVDPYEIENLSRILASGPQFLSKFDQETCEGIVGWRVSL